MSQVVRLYCTCCRSQKMAELVTNDQGETLLQIKDRRHGKDHLLSLKIDNILALCSNQPSAGQPATSSPETKA